MFSTRWLKRLAPLLVCLVLLVTACSTSAPDKYEQVQKDTTGFGKPAAVAKQAEKGGTFNQFFPKGEGDYSVVPSQEKKGFAQYKLNQNGTTLAMLTINDTLSLPAAAAKYDNATDTIAGYPSVKQGTTALGLLVNGRYQVKVLSRDQSFTEADRSTWLQKFDLAGLAKLEGVPGPQAKKAPKSLTSQQPKTAPSLPKAAPNRNLVPQPAA
ncbi:MAG: hypothetical protein AAF329_04850 [Cyanobacteria bacterium P01_A01_bin.17]